MVSKVQQWDDSSWGDTVSAVGVGSKLYTVEKDGTLYSTHAMSGEWKRCSQRLRHRRLLIANGLTDGDLFAIERNGNLYKIDRKTGDWEALSEDGDWSDTVAGDANGNKLFTIERDGTLYVTDLDNFDDDSEELDEGYGAPSGPRATTSTCSRRTGTYTRSTARPATASASATRRLQRHARGDHPQRDLLRGRRRRRPGRHEPRRRLVRGAHRATTSATCAGSSRAAGKLYAIDSAGTLWVIGLD